MCVMLEFCCSIAQGSIISAVSYRVARVYPRFFVTAVSLCGSSSMFMFFLAFLCQRVVSAVINVIHLVPTVRPARSWKGASEKRDLAYYV